MMKKIFSREINSITVAAILVAFSSLASRLLGVFRDRILAGQFGAGSILDAYYAAFRVPDFIFNIIVMGALTAGLIPIFSGMINDRKDGKCNLFSDDNKDAWKLISSILNLLGIFLIVISVLAIVFADQLTKLIAPGFSAELQTQTAILTRIMFLSPLFLGLSSVLGGVLQSFKRFFAYSLAPIMYNIGIIMGALFFVPVLGINGLAWGVAFGAFLHMIIQLPAVLALGFKYEVIINWKDGHLKKLLKMMIPRTLTLAVTQINFVAITIIATGLAAGSLTVFNLANNLQSFAIGIFGISYAVAAFPTLSAVAFNKERLIESFSNTIRQILFFIVPSTILLLTLRAQIIRVILGSGNFTWENTILTMETLGFFSISLFAQATIPLLIRVFYARRDSRTPFFIGLISVVANIILSIYFGHRLGVSGLALAFSLSSILNFVILWVWLHGLLGNIDEKKILISTIKFSLAAVLCGFVIQAMKNIVWPFIDMTRFLGVFVQGAAAGLCGLAVYFFICYVFKSEELANFLASFKKRLLRSGVKNRPASEEN